MTGNGKIIFVWGGGGEGGLVCFTEICCPKPLSFPQRSWAHCVAPWECLFTDKRNSIKSVSSGFRNLGVLDNGQSQLLSHSVPSTVAFRGEPLLCAQPGRGRGNEAAGQPCSPPSGAICYSRGAWTAQSGPAGKTRRACPGAPRSSPHSARGPGRGDVGALALRAPLPLVRRRLWSEPGTSAEPSPPRGLVPRPPALRPRPSQGTVAARRSERLGRPYSQAPGLPRAW